MSPQKVIDQINKAGLPQSGKHAFRPKLVVNRRGETQILKRAVTKGPKAGKRGYVDEQDRIWVKDHAHADLPDHWDVQLDDGDDYLRIDVNGEALP